MKKNFRFIAIAITILTSIMLAAFQIKFSSSWQDGLLVIITGFIISIIIGIEELRTLIEEEQKFNRLLKQSDSSKKLESLFLCIGKVFSKGEPMYIELIEKRLNVLSDYASEAANQTISVVEQSELISLPMKLMESVEISLDATIIWNDDDIRGKLGEKYFHAMARAIKNGVTIRRIFIVNCKEPLDELLKERINYDLSLGVKVGIIEEKDWLSNISKKPNIVDFGIWDNVRLWVYDRSIEGKKRTATLSVNTEKIQLYFHEFENN